MKPKNSKLGPGRPSLRRRWLGDSQNFTLSASSSGTLVAGGSLALEESEQKWGRCLLGVLRGFPSWVGDDLEDMSALQGFMLWLMFALRRGGLGHAAYQPRREISEMWLFFNRKQQVAHQGGSEKSDKDLGMEAQSIGWPVMCLSAFLARPKLGPCLLDGSGCIGSRLGQTKHCLG